MKQSPPNANVFLSHVMGLRGLVQTPLNSQDMVHWGALDLDYYPIDFNGLLSRIKELDLPLVVCERNPAARICIAFCLSAIRQRQRDASLSAGLRTQTAL